MVDRIGPYNNFDPDKIKFFIDKFDPFNQVEIRVGREGSPAMYFRTPSGVGVSQIHAMIEKHAMLLDYDEMDYVNADGVDGVRVWWD